LRESGTVEPGSVTDQTNGPNLRLLVLLGLWLLLTLPYLAMPLSLHPDERHYSIGAARMLDSGDFVVPRTAEGEVRLKKPPLPYYLVAAGFVVMGENRAGAKIFFVLCGLASITLTYALARRIGANRSAAGFGAAMLAGNAVFFVTATKHIPDMPLVLGCTLALLATVHLLQEQRKAAWPWYALSIGLATALMAKGLLAVVLLGLVVVVLLLHQRARNGGLAWPGLHAWLAAGIGTALSAWWFIAVWRAFPAEMMAQFGGDQVTEKVGAAPLTVLSGLGTNLIYLVLPFLPGFLALALVWRHRSAARATGGTMSRWAVGFLLLWCALVLAIFSFSPVHYTRYMLPAAPAVSALAALAAHRVERPVLGAGLRRSLRFLVIIPVLLGLLVTDLAWEFDRIAIMLVTLAATATIGAALWSLPARLVPWGGILGVAVLFPLVDLAKLPLLLTAAPTIVSSGTAAEAVDATAEHVADTAHLLVLDKPSMLDDIGLQTGTLERLEFADTFDPVAHRDMARIYFLDPAKIPEIEAAGFTISQRYVSCRANERLASLLHRIWAGDMQALARKDCRPLYIAVHPDHDL
jgi:4-amino-4-deoxy-L-arabinose transferase-like glycosyltransferase